MKITHPFLLYLSMVLIFTFTGTSKLYAIELDSTDITDADYESRRVAIEQKFNSDNESCNKLKGNEKKVCVEKAEATARVTQQELDAKYNGSVKGHVKASESKIDAQYDIDKVRCADLSGESKSLCQSKAESTRDKAKADISRDKKTLDATNEANKKKNDSAYELALKKCAALASESKDTCETAAKRKYYQ